MCKSCHTIHSQKAPRRRVRLPDGRPVKNLLRSFFAAQRKAVLAKVHRLGAKGVGTKDALSSDGWTDLSAWNKDMWDRSQPIVNLMVREGANDLVARLKLDQKPYEVANPRVRDTASKLSLRFAESTNRTTSLKLSAALDRVRAAVANNAVTGDNTIAALSKEINGVFDSAEKFRADRIARTEASRATHAGLDVAARESGVVTGYAWLLSDDACDECQAIAAANPKGIELGGSFGKAGDGPYADIPYPPAHPHCTCSVIELLGGAAAPGNEEADKPEPTETEPAPEPTPEPTSEVPVPMPQISDDELLARQNAAVEQAMADLWRMDLPERDGAEMIILKDGTRYDLKGQNVWHAATKNECRGAVVLLRANAMSDNYSLGNEYWMARYLKNSTAKEVQILRPMTNRLEKLSFNGKPGPEDKFNPRKLEAKAEKRAEKDGWKKDDLRELQYLNTKYSDIVCKEDAEKRGWTFEIKEATSVAPPEVLKERARLQQEVIDIHKAVASGDVNVLKVDQENQATFRYDANIMDSKSRARFDRSADWLSDRTHSRGMDDKTGRTIDFSVETTPDRACFNIFTSQLKTESERDSWTGTKSKSWIDVHEMGHMLEASSRNVSVHAAKFRAEQVEKSTGRNRELRQLKEITGISSYEDHEKAYKDGFWEPYTGKVNEQLSMGVQHLYEDPVRFAKEQPEHFKFTVACLRGVPL